MKKIILALIAAAGIYAVAPAPASAQTPTGMSRSAMDANAQMIVVRPGGGMRGERRMMRREMMRREMRRDRRMDRRMDRRRMMR